VDTPGVSVVIPTHNRAEFLRRAIGTVLQQTFQDFELIVVDDASRDHTQEVVASFPDERIRRIRHDHAKGGAAARNAGIRAARADWIAFLDDDDEWFPEKLAKQMEVVRGAPDVGCVYTGYAVVERATGKITGHIVPTRRGDLSEMLLVENCLGGTSSVLVRRDCLEKAGLFDERLPSFQDYDLWIRLSRHCRFDYLQEPLLTYYVHGGNIWGNLDALREGVGMMVEKHGRSPALRKYLSDKYLFLGIRYDYASQPARARESYLKAIRLYPLEIRSYLNLGLSLLGSRVVVAAHEAKAGMVGRLAKWRRA
jgi:glycosyltransferase involved in cell wall biosynthesis